MLATFIRHLHHPHGSVHLAQIRIVQRDCGYGSTIETSAVAVTLAMLTIVVHHLPYLCCSVHLVQQIDAE